MKTKDGPSKTDVAANNKVLIIDDSATCQEMFDGVLKSNGYETRCVSDGKDSLAVISDWAPSVILLDLMMPGMDGQEVCKVIRQANLPVRPSIIVVSAKDDKDTIVDALACGADDFVIKPFNDAELIARVKAQQRILNFYREIEQDKKNLESILEITTAVSASLDPSEVLNVIVNKVAGVTNAVRCSVVLVAKENEGYVLASHEDPSVTELKIDLAKYPEIQRVISTKEALYLNDMVSNPLLAPVQGHIQGLKEMSALVVPIVFNDEVLGTLFLRARRKEKGFSKKEMDFCRIVANSSFYAIRNAKLFDKITRERETFKEIAIKDHLTTLYNHNFFYTRLDEEFDRAVRYDTPLSVIMLDIDDFKNINDSYGHRVGDVVLREVSAMIKKGVRKTDVVARYGGEEFAVILPHTPLKGALEEGERLRAMIESHAYGGVISEKVTVSVGVAAYPMKAAMNSGDLVNRADDALYKAKWSGKNCVRAAE
ncbi:MAG: diguanylate cyclase [Deltaproteobacteria bacterium]|nr:diguanylate cyclase [Deltaproteobacteria bacterium]